MPYELLVRDLQSCCEEVGGKGRALRIALEAGVNVPKILVISAQTFDRLLEQIAGVKNIEEFMNSPIYDSHSRETLQTTLARYQFEIVISDPPGNLPDDTIVRSSSVLNPEYASAISGAYKSVRSPHRKKLIDAILEVWLSTFSERAYLQNRLIPDGMRTKGMAVLIQPYLPAYVSGLFHYQMQEGYTERTIEVSWIEGHLERLVSGMENGRRIRMYPSPDKLGVILIGQEETIHACQQPNLLGAFETLTEYASVIEKAFATSVEVEWLFDSRAVWILQVQNLMPQEDNFIQDVK